MVGFVELLRSFQGSGRVFIKCLYTPSSNVASHLPGRVVSGRLTFEMSVGEYQNFEDWMRNDDSNSLSPMKIKWTNGQSSVLLDLDDETLTVRTSDERVRQLARDYSFQERLRFRSRE